MRWPVGPFQIVERHDQFQVRRGRTVLAQYSNYLDAEDFALRRWLGEHHDYHEDEQRTRIVDT